ncbi:hypothetical protein MMC17_002456 [Xylographa soralifera]|nr:hypothetical protein [Xylographa soralifera]
MDLQDLRSVLQDAISQRGKYYEHKLALSIIWKDDDTRADKDVSHFQDMCKMLGFPHATECILDTNKHPFWDVTGNLGRISKQCDILEGKKLLMVHYGGHATVNINGELLFVPVPDATKPVPYLRTLHSLCEKHSGFEMVDVIIILDSCYSATAIHGMLSDDRSVEILASVGTEQRALGNLSYAVRTQNKTFTRRLAEQIALRVARAEPSINFAAIIAELRRTSNEQRRPEYSLQRGKVGIRIALPSKPPHVRAGELRLSSSSEAAGATSTPSKPEIFATFKVHLTSAEAKSSEALKLVEWIHLLHPKVGLTLQGLYSTSSTCLVLETPWYVWLQVQNLPGFELVCEAFGKNLLPSALSLINRSQ